MNPNIRPLAPLSRKTGTRAWTTPAVAHGTRILELRLKADEHTNILFIVCGLFKNAA